MNNNLPGKTADAVPNPCRDEVRNHVPAPGDVYADRHPNCNGHAVFRLLHKEGPAASSGSVRWKVEFLIGERHSDTIGESELKQYYRPILNDYDKVLSLARMISDGGGAAEAAALIGAGAPQQEDGTDSEALMRTESPEHIRALLDSSQRMQNRLEEIRLVASVITEAKKAELEAKLREMDTILNAYHEKVADLEKVISVLNLYTGATVELHRIAEGADAPAHEPLSLRQRIVYMDEELCVHLDHEADYKDTDLFFEWVAEPANRDIVIPEPRSIVTLKPKRRDMDYRSGDRAYDAIRNQWNKHTYILLRNGDNLFWAESDDLEVWDWAFPHEDFEEAFRERISKDPHFIDSKKKEYESVKYRVTRYMTFIQGLIDQRPDVTGTPAVRPNLLKLQGVRLIRDDERLVGTGRKPWREFVAGKNALIRRGTRILYIPGDRWDRQYGDRCSSSGGFVRYYSNVHSWPSLPFAGIYSSDTVDVVVRYDKGKPVTETSSKPVFRYLPDDEVFDRSLGWGEFRERRQRVTWYYDKDHVINYDAVTADELRGYLEDRTCRPDFAVMLPLLMRTLRMKEAEGRDEEQFKALLTEDLRRETGRQPSPEAVDEAVAWWKGKVVFTRPLRQDDAKAWRMIRGRVAASMQDGGGSGR